MIFLGNVGESLKKFRDGVFRRSPAETQTILEKENELRKIISQGSALGMMMESEGWKIWSAVAQQRHADLMDLLIKAPVAEVECVRAKLNEVVMLLSVAPAMMEKAKIARSALEALTANE